MWLNVANLEECPQSDGGQVLVRGVGLTLGIPGSGGI